MKLSENLIIALLKLGVVGEMKNFQTEIFIPAEKIGLFPNERGDSLMVMVAADNLQIRIEKGDR